MPNWNYNKVTIEASSDEVKKYLIFLKGEKFPKFNMNRLYPKVFPKKDKTWCETYKCEWAVEHTWAKWLPYILDIECLSDNLTVLFYETALEPNNKLLEKLHEATGWAILNEYEEPWMEFEGSYSCENGCITNSRGIYYPKCEVCDKKKHPSLVKYDSYDSKILFVCKICIASKSYNVEGF